MAKKKIETTNVSCMDCKNAVLMRNGQNPIIAICNIYNERQVAVVRRICPSYEQRKSAMQLAPWKDAK